MYGVNLKKKGVDITELKSWHTPCSFPLLIPSRMFALWLQWTCLHDFSFFLFSRFLKWFPSRETNVTYNPKKHLFHLLLHCLWPLCLSALASSCSWTAKCQCRCQQHGLPRPSTPLYTRQARLCAILYPCSDVSSCSKCWTPEIEARTCDALESSELRSAVRSWDYYENFILT